MQCGQPTSESGSAEPDHAKSSVDDVRSGVGNAPRRPAPLGIRALESDSRDRETIVTGGIDTIPTVEEGKFLRLLMWGATMAWEAGKTRWE